MSANNIQQDYSLSDVENLYKTINPKSWKDIISYLRQHSNRQMLEDFQRLKDHHASFAELPEEAFHLAIRHRGNNPFIHPPA